VEAARVLPFKLPESKAKIAHRVLDPSRFGFMNWIRTAFSVLRLSTFTIFLSAGFFEADPSVVTFVTFDLLSDVVPFTSFFCSGFSSLTAFSSSSSS
jgi:hypothetical protein